MTSIIPKNRPQFFQIDVGQQYWVDVLYREKGRVNAVTSNKSPFACVQECQIPKEYNVQPVIVGPATDSLTLAKGVYIISNTAGEFNNDVAIKINNRGPRLVVLSGQTRSIIVQLNLKWRPFS